MDDFVLTRAWVLEHLTSDELAAEVTLPGKQMRALLAAAYNGMRPVLASDQDVGDLSGGPQAGLSFIIR